MDTRCAVCGRLFEDGGYLFFKCKLAKHRWRALLLEAVRAQLAQLISPKEVVQAILKLPEEKKLLTVACLWQWWSERNRGNHGEKRLDVKTFQFIVRRHVKEWLDFLAPKIDARTPVQASWEPPPHEVVKINVDGAFDAHSGQGGWGLICRDSGSDIMFMAAGSAHGLADALHAETTALSNTVKLADRSSEA